MKTFMLAKPGKFGVLGVAPRQHAELWRCSHDLPSGRDHKRRRSSLYTNSRLTRLHFQLGSLASRCARKGNKYLVTEMKMLEFSVITEKPTRKDAIDSVVLGKTAAVTGHHRLLTLIIPR